MWHERNTTQLRMPTDFPIVDFHVHAWDGLDGLISGWTTEDVGYGRARLKKQPGAAADQPLFPDFVESPSGGRDELELRFVPPSFVDMKDLGAVLVEHMDWAGVGRAVILNGHPYHAVNNHAYIVKLLRQYPGRFIGTAQIDPLAPDALEQLDAAAGLAARGRSSRCVVLLQYGESAGRGPDSAKSWINRAHASALGP